MVWKKMREHEYFPFALLGLMMLVIHALIPGGRGDDIFARNEDRGLLTYLVDSYLRWSPRLLLISVGFLLSKVPFIIWQLLNTVIYTSVGVILSKLFVRGSSRQMNYFIAGMMIIYPFYHLGTAGWIAANVGFLYPLFCLLYCVLVIKKLFDNKKILWYEYVFYFAALLFASNLEPTAVVLATLFAVLIAYIVANKRRYSHILGISLAICAAQIAHALLFPGSGLRVLSETASKLPAFGDFTVIDKLNIGFYTTVIHFLASFDGVFLIFASLLLLTAIFKYPGHKLRVAAAAVPLLIWVVLAPINLLLNSPFASSLDGLISTNGFFAFAATVIKIGCVESAPSETVWLSFALLAVLFIILYTATRAFDKQDMKTGVLILALGFASRWIMGFSPSVYASSYRTFLFMYFSLIICTIILLNKQMPQLAKNKVFIGLFIAVCACSYMLNLFVVRYVSSHL